MSFESEFGELNEHYFFREFVFSKNTFRPDPSGELELADSLLWIGDVLVVYQLKARNPPAEVSPETEERWFERKVLGVAARQVRDTLEYLNEHAEIDLKNHRDDCFRLAYASTNALHKVICYAPDAKLPRKCRNMKYHHSATAGVIHLIAAADYRRIVQTLLTPAEFAEYLDFREEAIQNWPDVLHKVNESALLGQYLEGDASARPDSTFEGYVTALDHQSTQWDMSGVIKKFPERTASSESPTAYYRIVSEMAKLKRNELREFKLRFECSMEASKKGEFARPYRMAIPRTDCGFVFIPLDADMLEQRQNGLINLTHACKYDLRAAKCIGMSFAPDQDGWFWVEWCYMEYPWEPNDELEKMLEEANPFRDVRSQEVERYTYKNDD